MKPFTPRNPELARWLRKFSETVDAVLFKKGADLYRSHRVWDYHASEQEFHASVEDRDATFFQTDVDWINLFTLIDGNSVSLPDPKTDLNMHCTCGRRGMPCEHVVAAVIFWVMTRDGKHRDAMPRPVPEDDAFTRKYREKLRNFRKRSARQVASFAAMHVDSLKLRPDLQKKFVAISARTMHVMKGKR